MRGNDGGAVSVFSDKFLKLKISSFPQKQKTKIRNLKFVIPTKVGIQCVEFQLFRINFETLIPSFPRTYIPSFPRKWESRISDFQITFEYCCCSKV
ncbi:hypothetical protein BWZ30_10685 [Neisseria meningitidis]|nr:hypothetical protein BWZ30_10685 [Neisseria meningitidis]